MALVIPVDIVAPSCIPVGDNSHAAVWVALGLLIKLNWMCVSPFNLGEADRELNRRVTAIPIPTLSDIGMGPLGGIGGVIWIILQFWVMHMIAAA